MRPLHYDRQGRPITLEQWALLFEAGTDRVVEQTALSNGLWVSTVWLGLDHNYTGVGPPIIFETLVFPTEAGGAEIDGHRYATEEQARAGHAAFVRYWRQRIPGRLKKRIRAKRIGREREERAKAHRRARIAFRHPHRGRPRRRHLAGRARLRLVSRSDEV